MIVVLLVGGGLAGFDGDDEVALDLLTGTTAESSVTGLLASLWSEGTVGESLLTSPSLLALLWSVGDSFVEECDDVC